MKKYLPIIITLLLTPTLAFAVTVFNSSQVGTGASSGRILQTDGTVSSWVANSATLTGGSANTLTYWINGTTVGATSSPTIGYLTATTTATSTFRGYVNVQRDFQIGTAVAPQLDAFGTKTYELHLSGNVNDVVGASFYNVSTGAQAVTGLFFQNNKSPLGGIGALQTYYGGIVFGGGNWNGVPLGFGALPANGLAVYNTDGNLILGSATSTGQIDFYTGAGSFAGGVPDAILNFDGHFGIGTTSPNSKFTVQDNIAGDATTPSVTITGNPSFAKVKPFVRIIANNTTDTGDVLQITNPGTGYSINVITGTSTFQAGLDLRTSRVLQSYSSSALLSATSTLGTGTTSIPLSFSQNHSFTEFGCVGAGGGTFKAQIGNGTASTTLVTSATGLTTTYTTISTNNTFTRGQVYWLAFGSVSGAVSNPICSYTRVTQ